jgi:hypothetical protein
MREKNASTKKLSFSANGKLKPFKDNGVTLRN